MGDSVVARTLDCPPFGGSSVIGCVRYDRFSGFANGRVCVPFCPFCHEAKLRASFLALASCRFAARSEMMRTTPGAPPVVLVPDSTPLKRRSTVLPSRRAPHADGSVFPLPPSVPPGSAETVKPRPWALDYFTLSTNPPVPSSDPALGVRHSRSTPEVVVARASRAFTRRARRSIPCSRVSRDRPGTVLRTGAEAVPRRTSASKSSDDDDTEEGRLVSSR